MVPRLPWEFWDQGSLSSLLKSVGNIVRIDLNTLFRLKGKFTLVCVNIDITKPLPGSITISREGFSLQVPLTYEGLHEVCPLCGGNSHLPDACPKLPLHRKIKVIVKKLDAQILSEPSDIPGASSSSEEIPSGNWVIVTPKKRLRASFLPWGSNLVTVSQRPLLPTFHTGPADHPPPPVPTMHSDSGKHIKASSRLAPPFLEEGIILVNP